MKVMASSKYKVFPWKKGISKLDMIISCLRKENTSLKKILVELSRRQSEHHKLIEKFVTLETARLENYQQLADIEKTTALSSKQSQRDENQMETPPEALKKNEQRLEYDQQMEANVRAVMDRMSLLEEQLTEANQALLNQHNKDHSDEKTQMRQMQEYYESQLQRAKGELEVLRELVNASRQDLTLSLERCKESKLEVERLKQQLQIEKMSGQKSPGDPHCSEDKAEQDKTEDLKYRLLEEKRRSADLELQIYLLQKLMVNRHNADQEKIAELEQQLSGDNLASSTGNNMLNESFLVCPCCQRMYPASHYRELMDHVEICLDLTEP